MCGYGQGSLELAVRLLRNTPICAPVGYSRDLRRLEMVRHPNGTVQIFDVKAAIEVTEVV